MECAGDGVGEASCMSGMVMQRRRLGFGRFGTSRIFLIGMGRPEEYDRLYDVTAAAIQKELPEAKIGGPEATGVAAGEVGGVFAAVSGALLRVERMRLRAGRAPRWLSSAFIRRDRRRRWTGMCGWILGISCARRSLGMQVVASYPEWKNTPIILGESDPEGCAACKGPQNGYRNGPLYGVSVAEAIAQAE